MRRLAAFILALAVIASALCGATRKRTSKDVRRERQRTEQQIAATRKQIKQNDDETRRQLNRLNSLEANIALKNDTIGRLQLRLDSLDARIGRMTDSIETLEKRAAALRAAYARNLRAIRTRRQGMSDMAFIFSSESFSQAWRRLRYLRQTAKFNTAQARRVEEASRELYSARNAMQVLHEQQAADIDRINASRRRLAGERASADALVADLRRRGSSLTRELKRRNDRAAALDRELDRIIEREMREAEERRRREEEAARARAEAEAKARAEAEARAKAEAEARAKAVAAKEAAARPSASPAPASKPKPEPKPAAAPAPKPAETPAPAPKPKPAPKPAFASEAAADRALSGSFAANKGRLLFPVPGRYTITSNFGTNTHPGLAKVKVANLGIDIEVPAGTGARAVFDGVVSSIFRLEGYQNIVIVRHGEYLTVYGGLDRLHVKKGDKVKAGQQLGAIFIDRTDDNRTRLHFEIRHEKQKLNPVEWVR